MVTRLLDHQSSSILSAAFLLACVGAVSRMLGFFRNALLAAHFGAGDELDVYFAAFRIPDFLFNVLFLGALSAGFIPVFIAYWTKGEREAAWKLTNDMVHMAIAVFVVVSVALMLAAPLFMPYVVPGFSEEKLAEAIALTRIMLLQPLILAISGVFAGVLQSLRRFFVYALTPVFYNVGIIVGIVALAPRYGVKGLAWGVVIGAFLHALIQLPALARTGYRYSFTLHTAFAGLRRVLALMIPRAVGLMIVQVNLLITTRFASLIGGGALAVFNFASDLQGFSIGVIAASFAVAAFPTLAEEGSASKEHAFGETLVKTSRQIAFFLIPATALFIILRAQIVRVTLGYGAFAQGWEDTRLTAAALGILSIGILAQGLYLVVVRAFFALHDTTTPLLVGAASAFLNVLLSFWWVRVWGLPGLALAFVSANIVHTTLLFLMLWSNIPSLPFVRLLEGFVRFVLGGLFAAAVAYGTLYSIDAFYRYFEIPFQTNTVVGIFLQGLLAGVAGVGAYLALTAVWRLPEVHDLAVTIRRGIRKVPIPPGLGGEFEK